VIEFFRKRAGGRFLRRICRVGDVTLSPLAL
jgi:hypothetical protein